MGTWTTLLGPGCQATMAICFCMVWISGGFSRSVLYENVTTPSASSLSCLVQSCAYKHLSHHTSITVTTVTPSRVLGVTCLRLSVIGRYTAASPASLHLSVSAAQLSKCMLQEEMQCDLSESLITFTEGQQLEGRITCSSKMTYLYSILVFAGSSTCIWDNRMG